MVRSSFLKKFLVIGEKLVMNQMVEFTDMAIKTSELLQEILKIDPEQIDSISNEIMMIEKRGDELSLRLKQDIISGAISSNLMDNLVILVDKCDDILDKSYFISREIKRMSEYSKGSPNKSSELMRKSYEQFGVMLECAKAALALLAVMLKTTNLKVMMDTRIDIEMIEEKVDEYKDNIIDEVYKNADSLKYVVFSHLRDVVHKIDDMLDDCEDVADLIQTISLAIAR